MRWIRRNLHLVVPLVILILALTLNVADPGRAFTDFRFRVFDYFQRIEPRQYEPVPVKYIDIDEESMKKLGQWPWPRTILAEMVARVANMGAAALAFDIVFAEPDRTSPNQILPMWDAGNSRPELREAITGLPDHDAVFADVLAQANTVTGFVLTQTQTERAPKVKAGFAHAGDDPRSFVANFSGAAPNLESIEKASRGNGTFNLVPEQDSVIRRVPIILRLGDQFYPSLSAEALRVAQGASTYLIKSSGANMETAFGEHTGINNIRIGGIIVPTTAEGQIWIHYTEDVPSRRIPAWKIFTDDFDPSLVAGQILFVGTTAAGLKDLRVTPLNPVLAGVEVHVQAVEQILLGHFLQRPDWALGLELFYLLVVGLFLVFILDRVSAVWGVTAAGVAVAGAIGASWYLYLNHLWLFDPIGPAIVILALYLTGTLIGYLRTEAEKQQVRDAFGQYLSPALVEQLADEPDRLQLGGERKEMTFLFCDIRGFTPISELFQGDPQGLTRLINRFLTPMTNAILARKGTIDKYMGDCVMAFWNAPLDDPDHVRHACDAALVMFEKLDELNKQLREEAEAEDKPLISMNMGVGINSGECVVGNMGSEQRFDYSVLGDAVNLASRLEGQSKNYGIDIILGEDTYKIIKDDDYNTLELDLIAVKGKKEAVRVYGLLPADGSGLALDDLKVPHMEMLEAYRDMDWDRAVSLIIKCRRNAKPLTALYDLYAERIAAYRNDPPDPDWGGVYVAETK